jgi:hypothetical protein
MKNSLASTGLSLSQAQSISNLCNQACRDIDAKLSNLNNASKELTIGGETYVETQGHPITTDVPRMLKDKATYHATQAFLMENIKAKTNLINGLRDDEFDTDTLPTLFPKQPEYMEVKETPEVGEEWGWQQLSAAEYNEYLEAEAFAAHFGQFIHRGGKLDDLRRELPTLKTLEWISVEEGKKTPLKVTIHHHIDQLGQLHEELASIHRAFEQRVNYFKAKVKNLVTQENARIAKENAHLHAVANEHNAVLRQAYSDTVNTWHAERRQAEMLFEETRQLKIQEAAALRIKVDERFKPIVNYFLNQLGEE